MNRFKGIALALLLISIILWVSDDDYHISVAEAANYCDAVEGGSHPDYKNECGE